MTPRVTVVTDPMCSWCWGMAAAIDDARRLLGSRVSWDVALGGINIESRKPVGRFGAARLMDLWREVQANHGAAVLLDVAGRLDLQQRTRPAGRSKLCAGARRNVRWTTPANYKKRFSCAVWIRATSSFKPTVL